MRKGMIPKKYRYELLDALRKTAENREFLDDFLCDLLTPQEYETLAIRLQIVKLLADGLTQREIVDKLKIGIATVSRGARELQDMNGAFMKLLQPKTDSAWWSRSHS